GVGDLLTEQLRRLRADVHSLLVGRDLAHAHHGGCRVGGELGSRHGVDLQHQLDAVALRALHVLAHHVYLRLDRRPPAKAVALRSSESVTPSLSAIFAPPSTTTKGRSGWSVTLRSDSTSSRTSSPAAAGSSVASS